MRYRSGDPALGQPLVLVIPWQSHVKLMLTAAWFHEPAMEASDVMMMLFVLAYPSHMWH